MVLRTGGFAGGTSWCVAAVIATWAAAAVVLTQPQSFSFFSLDPDYAQHLYGVASSFQKGLNVPTHGYLARWSCCRTAT